MRFSVPTCLRENQRLKAGLWLVGGTLLVCLVVCYFFCPRFVIWRGLYLPEAWRNPEVNRAVDTLKQLRDPFVKINNPTNWVITWRLFFPLLAHWLHFPVGLYLALPHLGCALTTGYIVYLVWRHTGQRTWALMAASALASADWFFVSMGWLTYFDSWFALGLLVASFSPSRLATGAVCLVEPWIDERFVLALPVCAVVRVLYDLELRRRGWRALMVDFVLMALLTLPYVGTRMMLINDAGSANYLQNTLSNLKTADAWLFLAGWWAGFRMAWLYAVAFSVLVWRRQRGWVRITALAVVWGVTFMALFVASDISRNMTVALPALLLGVLMICSLYPRASRMVLPAVMLANLLLPATHVVLGFKLPVYYFYHELAEWRNPPAFVNPVAYANEGLRLIGAGKVKEAKHFLDIAIHLNPNLPEAYFGRGVASLNSQDFAAARWDLDQALQLHPRWADALYFRGLAQAKAGAREPAIRDLTNALECADHDWPRQQNCQSALEQLGLH
jgi:hypothetical protein